MVNNQKELLGFMSDTSMGRDHSNDLYGGDIMSTALVHHDPWDELKTITLNEKHLAKNHIISGNINAPAHAAFDVLRTRLLHTLKIGVGTGSQLPHPQRDVVRHLLLLILPLACRAALIVVQFFWI